MKRRRKGRPTGKSRYAEKVESGRQMYGGRGDQSCCAHRQKSIYLKGDQP